MFIVESSLPFVPRLALAATAIGTSALSTAVITYATKPYAVKFRTLEPAEGGALEFTTYNAFLQPRITRVYDQDFLLGTQRPFATWELAQEVLLPPAEATNSAHNPVPGQEETVAETRDKNGNVIGSWVVKWAENGEGSCRPVGNVVRYFKVHEELLS